MSKSIIIQEAGLQKSLIVDALQLKKFDGGSEDWIPEDGKNLVELQIGGSGTYKASDYNAYGIALAQVKPKYGGGATSKAAPVHKFATLHNIAIKEGDKTLIFSANELKVNNQGGGTSLWVPKDDVGLKTKYITKSGTYPASADECYGFSEVTVSGVDVEITQDDDGDDVAKVTDGGEVTETKLPSYINIEIPPTKTIYSEGDTIDFSGMVVKAYTKSGALWTDAEHPDGTIPLSELSYPVTTAVPGEVIEVVDDELVPPVYLLQVSVGNTILEYEWGGDWYRYYYTGVTGGPVYLVCIKDDGAGREESVFVSMNQFGVSWERTHPGGWDPQRSGASGGVATYEEYSAYIGGNIMGANLFVEGGYSPISANQPIGLVNAAILAINKAAAGQGRSVSVVPVDYQRPYDGRILEASFSITVMPQGPRED